MDGVFLSTVEKQLDAKRRLLIPQDFRTPENGAEHAIFVFPSIEADCLEAGGDPLFATYVAMIRSLPFSALEWQVLGEQTRLTFDGGGRVTLPESLIQDAGLGETVVIVGLGDRFQIWNREAWVARRAERRQMARSGVAELGALRLAAQLKVEGGGS